VGKGLEDLYRRLALAASRFSLVMITASCGCISTAIRDDPKLGLALLARSRGPYRLLFFDLIEFVGCIWRGCRYEPFQVVETSLSAKGVGFQYSVCVRAIGRETRLL
jgi:hypothetical protein